MSKPHKKRPLGRSYVWKDERLGIIDTITLHGVADGGGLRHNSGKDRWDLLPLDAVEQVVKVLTKGAVKYQPRNWERGMSMASVQASLQRHLVRRALGEINDPESGLPHLAHLACNALFLLAYDVRGMREIDDLEPFARKAIDQASKEMIAAAAKVPVEKLFGAEPEKIIRAEKQGLKTSARAAAKKRK